MSLENLHCPQFVDFTVPESFDINDGADFFFEKGVVGEFGAQIEMDLGTFGSNSSIQKDDPVQEITQKMTNLTNLSKENGGLKEKSQNEEKMNRPALKQPERKEAKSEDKENIKASPLVEKPVKDIAPNKLDSAISSAIEMILAANNDGGQKMRVSSGTPPPPDSMRDSFGEKDRDTSTPVYNQDQDKDSETKTTPQAPQSVRTPDAPTSANSLSKPTASFLNKQKQPVLTTANPNIVKKTLAKMTAAFKPSKPIVVQNSSEMLKAKRANHTKPKPLTASNADARSGRAANTSITSKTGSHNTSQDFRKRNDSTSNEARLARPMSPETSNRRCSSVPRTLRERQALNNSRLTAPKPTKTNFGEKIQNFFNSSNKTKQSQRVNQLKSYGSKNSTKDDPKDRRRSRSVNESINPSKTASTPSKSIVGQHRRSSQNNESINQTKPPGSTNKSSYTKITASPSFSKPRQKSPEKLPQGVTSFYTGVKFLPSNNHQLNIKKKLINDSSSILPAFSSSHASSATTGPNLLSSHLGSLPVDEILKNRPLCMQKNKPITLNTSVNKKPLYSRTTPGKSASFRNNPTNTSMTKPHPKSNVSDHALNVSSDKTTLCASATGNSSRVRKVSETNSSVNNGGGGYLHTELRALKRSEYEQQQKEKEKMAAIIKHEMDQEKLRKQQEEIQKIRNQRNFRSNPIKHYKPVVLKPSEKSLTEPKSPQLSTSTLRLNETSNQMSSMMNSTHRLSMALVDAPLVKRHGLSGKMTGTLEGGQSDSMGHKQRTVSQNDLRF